MNVVAILESYEDYFVVAIESELGQRSQEAQIGTKLTNLRSIAHYLPTSYNHDQNH